MKKVMLLPMVVLLMTSCFTPKVVTFNEDEFVKVYDGLNDTQDALYLKANEWMVSIFKDAKSVVQHSDKTEGIIIGKYLMYDMPGTTGTYISSPGVEVYAKIDIRVKDGKARLAIQPFDYTYIEGLSLAYTKENAIKDMNLLAESFLKYIQKTAVDF